MEKVKAIYFDMDGTIADLYQVRKWREGIDSGLLYPYIDAQPMWNMEELLNLCLKLKSRGYIIGIISWTARNGTPEYNKQVRAAKLNWLERFGLLYAMDEIHIVKYGTPKHTTANIRRGCLIDDNQKVREKWECYGGETIDPVKNDIIEILKEMEGNSYENLED